MPKLPNLHKFVKGLNPGRLPGRSCQPTFNLHKFVVQANFTPTSNIMAFSFR